MDVDFAPRRHGALVQIPPSHPLTPMPPNLRHFLAQGAFGKRGSNAQGQAAAEEEAGAEVQYVN